MLIWREKYILLLGNSFPWYLQVEIVPELGGSTTSVP
jgi:hypothetical protein